MGRMVPGMHHGSGCSSKNSEEKETPRERFEFAIKKTIQDEVKDTKTEGFHLGLRVSPRLQNIPKEKQPFYGSAKRRKLSASKDKVDCRKTKSEESKEQSRRDLDCLPLNKATSDIYARKTPKHVSEIISEGHLSVKRVSPRLKDIPADKRPYYGSVQRRQLSASKRDGKNQDDDSRSSHSFKDDIVGEKTKDETATKIDELLVQKIKSDRNLLKQQISPRHNYLNLEERLHHGNNLKRKLEATNGGLCQRKHEDRQGQVNISRIEDRATENDLALGFASMGRNSTAVVNFEDEAYLEFTRREPFLAHPTCGASVREGLVGPMVVMSTYKDSKSCGHNSNKVVAEKLMLDVTLRKNGMQNTQKIGLTGLPLERRTSPRLRNILISKPPFNGSNQKGKLNAANDNISNNNDQNRQSSFPKDRIPINDNILNKNDQNRQAYSLKDKISVKNSSVDHFIRELLPIVGRKDIGDRNAISLLDAGSGRVNYENGEIVDLEKYASPKSLGYKRYSAPQMCEEDGVKMKGIVRALAKNQPFIVQGRAIKDFSELPGLVCEDISYGKESMPIPATNFIDPPTAPSSSGFKYINTFKTGKDVVIPPSPPGCNCRGNCTNPKYCSCARLNGSDFPYVNKDGGRLIEPKDVVFECGPLCGCGPNCVNRTSQRGLKYQLEVYRTMNKGWAVRSWDFIPSGAFVCEYIGVIRKTSELDNDNVYENDFIFQIDCWHTMKGIGGRERRQGDVSKHARSLVDKMDEVENETEFCVDGVEYGNVTRFINHSCDPNLFVQCVLSSHRDIRLARIVLYAADDIPPMQELTYDYGYELDSVIGPDGKIKKLPCYCGTNECRGRLY